MPAYTCVIDSGAIMKQMCAVAVNVHNPDRRRSRFPGGRGGKTLGVGAAEKGVVAPLVAASIMVVLWQWCLCGITKVIGRMV